MKNTYGYWGIVILTPIVISIPIGVFLLLQYFTHHKYKLLHLSLSVILWSLTLITFFKFIWQ